MTDTPFLRLTDLCEAEHARQGHSGSFQGCTLGECPEIKSELEFLHCEDCELKDLELANLDDELASVKGDLEEARDKLRAVEEALS